MSRYLTYLGLAGTVAPMSDLPDLLESWLLSMKSENKADATVKTYGDGVHAFFRWAAAKGIEPALERDVVNAFIADLLASGAEPTTAASRQLSVRRFSAWLASEDEIDSDRLIGLRSPRLDQKVVEPLSDEQLAALLGTCSSRSFLDRRDAAIIRVATETTARAEELVCMTLEDTDVRLGQTVIRRGKGGKGRIVPFSPQAAAAVDRYLRVRKTHRLAGSPALWLGGGGKTLGYHGLRQALGARARQVGIEHFHLHRLRHTAATRWLAAGGSQDGLMAVAGWTDPAMLHRYVKASQSARAISEARRLNLGEM